MPPGGVYFTLNELGAIAAEGGYSSAWTQSKLMLGTSVCCSMCSTCRILLSPHAITAIIPPGSSLQYSCSHLVPHSCTHLVPHSCGDHHFLNKRFCTSSRTPSPTQGLNLEMPPTQFGLITMLNLSIRRAARIASLVYEQPQCTLRSVPLRTPFAEHAASGPCHSPPYEVQEWHVIEDHGRVHH
jgi:hypothetical protein